MKVPSFLRLALVGMLSAGGFTSELSAQVIYREIFGAPSGSDLSANVFDWQQFASNGTVLTGARINTSAVSKPTDLANVNAGTNSDGSTGPLPNGMMYVNTAPANLAITTEYSFDPANYSNPVQFSWYAGNAGASSEVRLTLRIDSTWYVSTTAFSTPSTGLGAFGDADPGGAQFQSIVFDPTASMWSILNFDGDYVAGGSATDSTLGNIYPLGASPGSDLSGTITAFGIYSSPISGGNTRFDTFQIAVVPEPSVVGLVFAGGLALLGLGRRFSRQRTICGITKG